MLATSTTAPAASSSPLLLSSSPIPSERQACTCGCHKSHDSSYAATAAPASPTAVLRGAVPLTAAANHNHNNTTGNGMSGPASPRPSSACSERSSLHDCELCFCSVASDARPFLGKTVLLLRTSSTARAPVYASLRRMGMHIIIAQPVANRASFGPECVDEWIEIDTTDVDGIIDIITAPPFAGRIDAVASFDEYGVFPAAVINKRLGFQPMPLSPEALSMVNIKSRFREWCVASGIPAPRFAPLRTPDVEPAAAVRGAGLLYPLVVKPAPGAGSNLVTLVDSEAELGPVVARLWAAIDAMKPTAAHFEALGEPIHVLLEEFVEGPEVDVDAIVQGGEVRFAGVSDNFPTARPYFSEVGGLAPSALPTPQQDALVALLEQFVAATSAMGEALTGVLHFEAKYDVRRDVAVVIEVNCRMGSAETHTMVKTGFGVDLGEAAMRLALGMPLQSIAAPHVAGRAHRGTGTFAASANLYPQRAGALVEIRPPAPQPHLLRAMPFPMPRGAPVKLPPESFGCLLWLVADGASAEAAVARMKAMCDESAIVVE